MRIFVNKSITVSIIFFDTLFPKLFRPPRNWTFLYTKKCPIFEISK